MKVASATSSEESCPREEEPDADWRPPVFSPEAYSSTSSDEEEYAKETIVVGSISDWSTTDDDESSLLGRIIKEVYTIDDEKEDAVILVAEV